MKAPKSEESSPLSPATAGTSQIHKFKETAREAETDDSKEGFERALSRVAKASSPKPISKEKQREGFDRRVKFFTIQHCGSTVLFETSGCFT